jgi:hypothetical protein
MRPARREWLRRGHSVTSELGKGFVLQVSRERVVLVTVSGHILLSDIEKVFSDFSDLATRAHAAMLWTRVNPEGALWVPDAQDCAEELLLLRMRALDPTVTLEEALRAIDWALAELPILEPAC